MIFFQYFIKYSIHHPLSADTSFKFLAVILFEIRHFLKFHPFVCQRAVILQGGIIQRKPKIFVIFFHEESIHEVSRRYLDTPYIHTYGQAETNMSPLFQSWGHKKMKGGVCFVHGLQYYVRWLIKNAKMYWE